MEDGAPGGPRFRIVLQMRSTAEETLVVDAADLWDQPARVLARFGPEAETDLLLALRRGVAARPPLGRVLEQARPAAISLDDGDLNLAVDVSPVEIRWADEILKARQAVAEAHRILEAADDSTRRQFGPLLESV